MNADEVALAERLVHRDILDRRALPLHSALETEVHLLLHVPKKLFVWPHGFVAQNVHVEANTLLDYRLPNTARTQNADSLAGHLVAQKRQVRMPIAPAVLAHQMFGAPQFASQVREHEEGELRGRFGQDVSGVGEGNFVAVRVGAADVIESDGV